MPEDDRSHLNLINSSGFLFQERVHYEVERTFRRHGFHIAASEYHWRDTNSNAEGYIDLVLTAAPVPGDLYPIRLILECKRMLDTNWVFLVPRSSHLLSRSQCLWTYVRTDASFTPEIGWGETNIDPRSYESSICIMRGQNSDKPILERLLSILTVSIESLAHEESQLQRPAQDERRLYAPIVVTNSEITVCRYAEDEIDLSKGMLSDSTISFETVPWIRFSKSLATHLTSTERLKNLSEAHRTKERTVYVVTAHHLPDF